MTLPGYSELELDLPAALLEALLSRLESIPAAKLLIANVGRLPEAQGVYTLHLKPKAPPIYIGKTDSEAGLRHRLSRHSKKLLCRHNITQEQVYFRAVRLFVFTAMDLESTLIQHYGGVKNVAWNNSGFGSNDPGKERDTTKFKNNHFDTLYPIDIDYEIDFGEEKNATVAEHLSKLKSLLPYNFRFERPNPNSKNSFHEDFLAVAVPLQRQNTPRRVIETCMAALPAGWHATLLPSHIICYKNDPRNFPSGELIAHS